MKKESWVFLLIILTAALMAAAVKSGSEIPGKLSSMAAEKLTDPLPVMKNEIPLLLSSEHSQNVFSKIYEEDEDTDKEIKLEIDNTYTSPITPKGKARVLVYHTHICEAYSQTDTYKYTENGSYRTAEQDKSVAKVGADLCKYLESHGITAVHDTTNFEPPKLGTAYTRSLQMLEKRIKDDGEYDIYIDIHRDAYDPIEGDTVTIDGQPAAKVMVVIGTGEGNNGTPILPRPDYKSNYAYAKKVTDNINSQVKGLAKDVRVNKSRYNQHISKKAILIEMGYTGNNLDQVLRSVPYVAKAVADTVQK